MRLCRDRILSVDPINKEKLCKLVDSPRTPVSLYKRAMAVLLLAKNIGPSEVARRTGLHRGNVYIWSQRFYENGVSGLRDLPRRRKPRLPNVSTLTFEQAEAPGESTIAVLLRQLQ